MERAMGIEPTSEAWEACNLTQETLDWRLSNDSKVPQMGNNGKWKTMENFK
jgi:hypothetical protein